MSREGSRKRRTQFSASKTYVAGRHGPSMSQLDDPSGYDNVHPQFNLYGQEFQSKKIRSTVTDVAAVGLFDMGNNKVLLDCKKEVICVDIKRLGSDNQVIFKRDFAAGIGKILGKSTE